MNFINTDSVKEEVEINQILGYWEVCDQVNWQMYGQVYGQVYLQVLQGFLNPIFIKIKQELNK